MSLTEVKEKRDNVLYLGILKGDLISKSEEGAVGAQLIKYTDSEDKPLEKWAIVHENLTGIITGAEFVDGKFTEQLVLTINNSGEIAKVYVSVKSRFFEEIGKKLANIDLTKEVILNTMDFVGRDDKRVVKFKVEQEGKVIYGAYWDNDKQKVLKGFPVMEGDWSDETDRTIYNALVVKFLKKEIKKIKFPKVEIPVSLGDTEVDGLPF